MFLFVLHKLKWLSLNSGDSFQTLFSFSERGTRVSGLVCSISLYFANYLYYCYTKCML